MHRAWQVTDLVLEILDLVEVLCGSRKDLLSLSLSSKALHDLALDRIWYHIPHLRPLVDCLPDDLWCKKEQLKVLLRDILPSDWTSLQNYARRVRSFGDECHGEYDVSPNVYRALYQASGGRYILPNLKKLILDYAMLPGRIFFADMLLGPSITECRVKLDSFETHSPQISCILRRFLLLTRSITRLSSLEELDLPPIHHKIGTNDLSHVFYFLSAQVLTNLAVGSLSTSALIHISRLPRLKSLHIRCHGGIIVPDSIVDLQSDTWRVSRSFPSLESIRIDDCGNFYVCEAFLRTVSSPTVESLSIGIVERQEDTASWGDIIETLRARWKATLRHLTLSYTRHSSFLSPQIHTLSYHDIFGLLHIYDLKTFGYTSSHSANFDDGIVVEMARAWPRIEQLRLKYRADLSASPVSLQAIANLRDRCLRLKYLACTFIEDYTFSQLGTDRPNDALEVLEFYNCSISDPLRLATFLNDSFPGLQKMVVSGTSRVNFASFMAWRIVGSITGVEWTRQYY